MIEKELCFVHDSLMPALKNLIDEVLSKEDVLFISTYKPHFKFTFSELVEGVRRRENKVRIVLLTFQPESFILSRLNVIENIRIVRLPLDDQSFTALAQQKLTFDTKVLLDDYRKAQKIFVDVFYAQLKHGKQSEFLGSAIYPLKWSVGNLNHGLGSITNLSEIAEQIRLNYLNEDRFEEFLYCLSKISQEEPYLTLQQVFLELLLLLGICENPTTHQLTEIADKIDLVERKFNYLKRTMK